MVYACHRFLLHLYVMKLELESNFKEYFPRSRADSVSWGAGGPEIDNLISVHFDTVAPRKKNLIWLQSHLKIG